MLYRIHYSIHNTVYTIAYTVYSIKCAMHSTNDMHFGTPINNTKHIKALL